MSNKRLKSQDICEEYVDYNLDNLPIVYAKFKKAKLNDNIFKAHLNCMKELLDGEHGKICIIFDMIEAEIIDWTYINEQKDFLTKHDDLVNKNLICTCFVIQSPLIRVILDTFFTLRTPKKPVKLCDEPNTAFDFCYKNCKESNI